MSKINNSDSASEASASNHIFSVNSNYALFVGKKFGYYATKWEKILQNKCGGNLDVFRKGGIKQTSWNVFAFLFGPMWFAYRKMYFFTILNFLAFGIIPQIYPVLGLVMAVLFGIYGNAIYFRFVDKKLRKLEKNILNQDILKSEIINSGATSKLGLVVVIILMSIAISLNAVAKNPNFSNSLSAESGRIPQEVKDKINSTRIAVTKWEIITIQDAITIIAGEDGKVEWLKKWGDYYVQIERPSAFNGILYLKFSYDIDTNFISLSEVGAVGRKFYGDEANDFIASTVLQLASIKPNKDDSVMTHQDMVPTENQNVAPAIEDQNVAPAE